MLSSSSKHGSTPANTSPTATPKERAHSLPRFVKPTHPESDIDIGVGVVVDYRGVPRDHRSSANPPPNNINTDTHNNNYNINNTNNTSNADAAVATSNQNINNIDAYENDQRYIVHEAGNSADNTSSSSSSSRSSKRSRARMAARVVSKPLRKSMVTVVAGIASTVGLGQAMFLKATYQSPPDARGPRSGIEFTPGSNFHVIENMHPLNRVKQTQKLQQQQQQEEATQNDDKGMAPPPKFSIPSTVDGNGLPSSSLVQDDNGNRPSARTANTNADVNMTTPSTISNNNNNSTNQIENDNPSQVQTGAHANHIHHSTPNSNSNSNPVPQEPPPSNNVANGPATTPFRNPSSPARRRILILGDSLVSGVGGSSSYADGPSDGPALPRQVARSLCDLLGEDIAWDAISLTGGDVRVLRRKIIPMLQRERERGTLEDVIGVVLVTGVNDWKRLSPSRTAGTFRVDLEAFVDDIRANVRPDCKIILPAIPGVRHSPRFHEPLRSIVIFLNELWDAQKLWLARKHPEDVFFVGQPANAEWGENPLIYFSTLDRVHPSELGYQVWAERIAKVMQKALCKGNEQAANANNTSTATNHSSVGLGAVAQMAGTGGVATPATANHAKQVCEHQSQQRDQDEHQQSTRMRTEVESDSVRASVA